MCVFTHKNGYVYVCVCVYRYEYIELTVDKLGKDQCGKGSRKLIIMGNIVTEF